MGKKILFVDDSASMRKVLGMTLKRSGYEVETAEDGKVAFGLLDSCRFDVIITDLNMPNMNGIEFIKAAKTHPNNKFAPIIMLTTESSEEMRKEGQDAGAKVWIVKPFRPDKLLEVLKKVIG